MATDKEIKIWDEIVEELRGTAGNYVPEEFENDSSFLNYLDDKLFICTGCGWWCERGEESDMFAEHCDNCAEDLMEGDESYDYEYD